MLTKVSIVRLLLLVAIALMTGAGPASGAAQQHSDPRGDSNTAPDITTMTVADDPRGTITFTIGFANEARAAFRPDELEVLVPLDTDQNTKTGYPQLGSEYFIHHTPKGTHVLRDDLHTAVGGANATFSNDTLTLSFERAKIGAPAAFDYFVLSGRANFDSEDFDSCPDSGTHAYALELRIARLSLPGAATRPVAGSVMSVRDARVTLNTRETIRPTTLRATLRLSGRTLKPLAGGNSWRIPRAAKGKTVTLTVTAAYRTASKTATFQLRVR